ANKIPGLGDIPILGRLFGSHRTDREKSEVVLSITPRIIRMQQRPASDTTEFWYGTETRTRTAPYAVGGATDATPTAPAGAPMPPPIRQPAIPSGSSPPAVQQGLPANTVPAPLIANQAAATGTPQSAASAKETARGESVAGEGSAATSPAQPALSLEGPASVRAGDEFDVTVHLSTPEAITRLRSQVRFDPTAVQLITANTGEAVPATAGSPRVTVRPGGAQLEVIATPDDPVRGDGGLMVLRFKAVGSKPSTSIAAMLSVIGGTGAAVGNGAASPLSIAIQP
ncbi:MAG: hypothetical protein JWO52_5266, partial [Gammaproteobacteria bacterium]|nr:hypothetical protein [Gammaproteobacteria bacterium]